MTTSSLSPQLPLLDLAAVTPSWQNFVVGANQQTVAALQDFPTQTAETFLYLFGPAGCGKTHCLHALQVQVPSSLYWDLNQPLNTTFSAPLLLLDNAQALAGNAGQQEALFALYNQRRDAGVLTVISGSDVPDELGLSLPDLISRLQWGLSCPLQPLTENDIRTALQQRAADMGLHLSAEVLDFLLLRLQRDMGLLSSILAVLNEASLIEQRKITIPFIKKVLSL